jgi:outer membrane lipoprotein SlyB
MIQNLALSGIGPLIGGAVGYGTGKVAGAEAGAIAGVVSGIISRKATVGGAFRAVGMIGRGLWTVSKIRPPAPGPFAVGYVAGAIVGTGVSYALFGEEGAQDAIDLYTGQVPVFSISEGSLLETISDIPGYIQARNESNRAVPGNAAGIPGGTELDPTTGQPRQVSATVQRYIDMYESGQYIGY